MRYPLAGRDTLSTLIKGSGFVTIGAAALSGIAKRALGPLAVPAAIGSGLIWLGRNLGDSFVELGAANLHVKMGALFDQRIPMSEVRSVEPLEWKALGGFGVRTNLTDMIAVVTRAGPAAEIRFWEPMRLPVIPRLWHVNAQRLIVSPERTAEFIRDLESRIGP